MPTREKKKGKHVAKRRRACRLMELVWFMAMVVLLAAGVVLKAVVRHGE
jgi:hypothetical protein